MPKKTEKKSAADMISWIHKLPEAGGAWGKGIIDTIDQLEVEAMGADEEIVALEAQVKSLKDKAAQRRSMAMQTARRAAREAPKLFDPSLVKQLTASSEAAE